MCLDIFNGGPKKQPAASRQLRQLLGSALEDQGNRGRRCDPPDDGFSRAEHVPGYFQRGLKQQSAAPRQMRQRHRSALNPDAHRRAGGDGKQLGLTRGQTPARAMLRWRPSSRVSTSGSSDQIMIDKPRPLRRGYFLFDYASDAMPPGGPAQGVLNRLPPSRREHRRVTTAVARGR
jgi:hypothetical protein